MRRISITKEIDTINFQPSIVFCKDGKSFAKFDDLDIFRTLTAVLGSEEAAEIELLTMLKYELNDPLLEEELIEVWNETKNKK